MEPTKFEEQSREKFEEREMQPSANAWDNLEKMLDAHAPAKKKSPFRWFAIAATFIGFIIIASIVFNKARILDNPEFVEETIPSQILETKEMIPQGDRIIAPKIEQNEMVATKNETKEDALTNENVISSSNDVLKKKETLARSHNSNARNSNKNKRENAQTSSKNKSVSFQKPKKAIAFADLNDTKTAPRSSISEKNKEETALVVQNEAQQTEEIVTAIAKTNVDQLLKAAREKIRNDSERQAKKIDAMALLGDIEMANEQSLRTKVFYALGEGLDYVKSSVIDRGN